jgi:hypothetical protein
MSRHRCAALVFSTAIVALISVSLSAQRTVARSIFIDAVDSGGRPVTDLTAEDFTITESGSKRKITRASLGSEPMRIVLMVDSSTPVGPMINQFKNGLTAFVDTLAPLHQVAFISSGGQIRVRAQPADSRDKLRAEVARFSSEGGANAFLDTLLEADKRFFKPAPSQWPVAVIITTDNGDSTKEPDVVAYNKFMNDFLARGGAAHAVILTGKRSGPVTDIVANLVDNTSGFRQTINTDNSLPARMKDIAERIDSDHRVMSTRYELAYDGDPTILAPVVQVAASRDDIRLKMSVRRPF